MATGLYAYSKTAASNSNASSEINWAEGQTAGSVNNSARQLMADLKKWSDDTGGQLTTAGAANTFTLATNLATDTLADGICVDAVMNVANTGAATLNVNSKGALAIRKIVAGADVALTGGELQANGHYTFKYDASANAAAGAWIINQAQPIADTVTAGIIELATDAETQAGTAIRAITPSNLKGKTAWVANKNAVDQTGTTSGAYTKVTYGTEELDRGGVFASSTATPGSAGEYEIVAAAPLTTTNGVTLETNFIAIYKNGAVFRETFDVRPDAARSSPLFISAIVTDDGNDTFDIYVKKGGAGTGTVDGTVARSWFQGTAI